MEALLRNLHNLGTGYQIIRSTHLETIGVFQEAVAHLTEASYPQTQCRAKVVL